MNGKFTSPVKQLQFLESEGINKEEALWETLWFLYQEHHQVYGLLIDRFIEHIANKMPQAPDEEIIEGEL